MFVKLYQDISNLIINNTVSVPFFPPLVDFGGAALDAFLPGTPFSTHCGKI